MRLRPPPRRVPLAAALGLGLALAASLWSLLATPDRAAAQGIGSDGQSTQLFEGAGHFENADGACGGPSALDDTFSVGIAKQPDRTTLFLQRKSLGQTATLQVEPDGTLTQVGGASETYEQGRLDGRVVTARYGLTTGSCTQHWDLVVTIPDLVVGEIVTSTTSTLFDVERALRERGRPSESSDGTPIWPLVVLVALGVGAVLLARRRGGAEADEDA